MIKFYFLKEESSIWNPDVPYTKKLLLVKIIAHYYNKIKLHNTFGNYGIETRKQFLPGVFFIFLYIYTYIDIIYVHL